ncbi:MAG: hypothetical protein ACOC9W_05650 [Persicimonas sp.]
MREAVGAVLERRGPVGRSRRMLVLSSMVGAAGPLIAGGIAMFCVVVVVGMRVGMRPLVLSDRVIAKDSPLELERVSVDLEFTIARSRPVHNAAARRMHVIVFMIDSVEERRQRKRE